MSFTHLHLASGFSFKYGTTLPHLLVEKARDFGMGSLIWRNSIYSELC
jgi:DNA polymerase III alpha subunit